MNKGVECRIKKKKEEVEENKCNNFYISDFICNNSEGGVAGGVRSEEYNAI